MKKHVSTDIFSDQTHIFEQQMIFLTRWHKYGYEANVFEIKVYCGFGEPNKIHRFT